MADLGNAKISLAEDFQYKIFCERMTKITRHQSRLSNFDCRFFDDIQNKYDSAGRSLQLTRKQMNYLGEIVASLAS
jgi:hypothetical protein